MTTPRTRAVAAMAIVLSTLLGCATAPRAELRFGGAEPAITIDGLSSCLPSTSGPLEIDRTRPITVLVHGCNFSRGDFRTLSAVFEAHDQQTICFSYDDRERLERSAARLRAALAALETHIAPQQITVLGHSQGGLVARRALIAERGNAPRPRDGFSYRLVTVSSPFGGIASSKDCGSTWLRVLSLGVTAVACEVITGSKWHEIYAGSAFMTYPGTLEKSVHTHVKIVTDERGACTRRNRDGTCAAPDFVFTTAEQANSAVDADARMANVRVAAGHVEIVGERGNPPLKLIRILQEQEILARTRPERRQELAALLRRLY